MWLAGRYTYMHCHNVDWLIGCCSQVSTRALPHEGYVKWLIGCGSQVGKHTLPHVDWLIICGTQVGTRALPRPTRTQSPATSTSLSPTWRPASRSGRGIREIFFFILKIIFTVFERCFFLIFKTYLKILFFDFWCIQGQFLTVSYNPIGRKIILFFVWHYSHILYTYSSLKLLAPLTTTLI